jgi:16S rRNA (cytidine1402-2'-O)-methyltransferase
MIYIIPTPIGNMGDITYRGKELLLLADCLVVENFQTATKLLKQLGRVTMPKIIPFVKNEQFNEYEISNHITKYEIIGVVSEAGMPVISDPGYLLVEYLAKNNLEYTVLPGACSVDTAVAASGLVNKGYIFLGFIPTKKGRQTFWKELAQFTLPVVIFESVHRIEKCIEDMQANLKPDSKVFIARELTKLFETYIHTTVGELKNIDITQKGEFVIVIRNNIE